MIAQAAGGTISVTGEGDRAPVKPGPSLGDTGTGMLMAISILAALYQRSKSGQGRLLQVAMQDAMLHYMRVPFSRTQRSGEAVLRDGSSRSTPGGLTPSALYPCQPGGPNDYVYVFCSRLPTLNIGSACSRSSAERICAGTPATTPAGAQRARRRSRRHHRRLDPPAFQAEAMRLVWLRRRAGRSGFRHARTDARSFIC